MKRRAFVRAAATGGAVATLAAPPVQAQAQSVKWRLVSAYPKSLDTIFGAAEAFSKRVSSATGGKFEISVHAAGEIVPALQVLDAVQQQTVECCQVGAVLLFGKDATFALDAAIPFGMSSRQMTAWMYHGGGMQLMREFYRDYNVINFPGGNTGAQMAGWFRKELSSVEDLKGLRFRIGGFGGLVLAKLGGIPQNIAPGDIYPALEKGTIDAAEFVGPYDDEKLGLHKIAKYYYYPGFWEGGSQLTFFIGAKAWEGLPKEYQSIVEAAAAETHVNMQAKYDAANPVALKRLVSQGTELRSFSRPMLEAAWKATNEVFDELSAKNPKWKKVYEPFAKFRDDELLWFRFSDYAFDSFMMTLKR